MRIDLDLRSRVTCPIEDRGHNLDRVSGHPHVFYGQRGRLYGGRLGRIGFLGRVFRLHNAGHVGACGNMPIHAEGRSYVREPLVHLISGVC